MIRNWLVAIRTEHGFSQKYVSEQIGIAQPYYCTIETGKRQPAVKTAKKIAKVLDFNWTRFYEDIPAGGGEGKEV